MKLRIAAIALVAAAPAAAQTMIKPGDAFLLGGEQTTPLTVTGRNIGPVPVDLIARVGGLDTRLATIAPGQAFRQIIGARQIAVFRNTSSARGAEVDIDLDKRTFTLSMRYQNPD